MQSKAEANAEKTEMFDIKAGAGSDVKGVENLSVPSATAGQDVLVGRPIDVQNAAIGGDAGSVSVPV